MLKKWRRRSLRHLVHKEYRLQSVRYLRWTGEEEDVLYENLIKKEVKAIEWVYKVIKRRRKDEKSICGLS